MKYLFLALGLIFCFPVWSEPLSVGLAGYDATPEIGVPLSGFSGRRIYPWDVTDQYPYSTVLKPSTGIKDPIRAKAMYLDNGQQKLLFMSVDVVGITSDLRAEVITGLSQYGIHENNFFMSATHSHSGPGAWSKNLIWELVMIDFYHDKVRKKFVHDLIQAAKQAIKKQVPAELFSVSYDIQGLQKNRHKKAGLFINKTNLLLVKTLDTNKWLGGMVNFAIHGTAIGQKYFEFSADIPGSIERHMEKLLNEENGKTSDQTTMLFINGAVGDVTTKLRGSRNLEKVGRIFAQQSRDQLKKVQRLSPNWKVKASTFTIGDPGLHLRACVDSDFMRSIYSSSFKLPIDAWFPKKITIWWLELGNIAMMTWPGEPTTKLGIENSKMAFSKGLDQAWIMGLTNDYLAYFTTPDEFDQGGYEACFSLYGKQSGKKILSEHKALSQNLATRKSLKIAP